MFENGQPISGNDMVAKRTFRPAIAIGAELQITNGSGADIPRAELLITNGSNNRTTVNQPENGLNEFVVNKIN